MKDREVLFMAYGALKALQPGLNADPVVDIIENHLWPKPEFIMVSPSGDLPGLAAERSPNER